MANNFNKPTVSDNYATTLIPAIKDNQTALALALDPAVVSVTNPPTNAVRWSSANKYWEKYNGSSWMTLATTYGISISGNAGTATKISTGRTIAVTGDATGTSSAFDGSSNCSFSVTLATVNGNVGSFGSATQGLQVTVNAKGLITAISAVTITPAWSSITSKPTTLSGYGITNAAPIASPTFTGTVTLPAGSTTVAPEKRQAGSILTTPVAHAFEYDGTYLYQTTSTATRKQIAYADGTGASGSWGISITGSSASCTGNSATATNSTQLGGVAAANFAQYGANQSWSKGQRGSVSAIGSGGATVTLDLNTSNNFSVTANTASWTLANPTNIASAIGQSGIIAVTQDATGSRVIAWGTQWVAAGGKKPVLSTAANVIDLLSYYVIDATHILVAAVKGVS